MSTLTLQPSGTLGVDAQISEGAPTTNAASGTTLTIGTTRILGTDYSTRALLRFDISSIPSGSLVTSGTLTLYSVAGDIGASRTFYAYRIAQTDWTESGVTWNTYDGTNNWATAGLGAGTDYVTTDGDSVVIATPGDLVFDGLAALCNDAYANRSGFLHLVIIGPEGVGETEQMIVGSSDHATSGLRPQLVVEYEYSTHYACALAIQNEIQGLALEGLTSARINVQKTPQYKQGTEPGVVISHWETEAKGSGTNVRDDWGFPVMVSLYSGSNQSQTQHAARLNLWRQRIMRHFSEQRLTDVPEVWRCEVIPRPVIDPSFFQSNVDHSSFTVRCWARTHRGALA